MPEITYTEPYNLNNKKERCSFVILLIVLCFSPFLFNSAYSQVGEWVWIHGSNAAGNLGSYGTQGVSSPTNMPPALYEANEWTDNNGNFWLYGGILNNVYRNDLWKYNPVTNEWTWMKGTNKGNDTLGFYGTKGLSSPANHPPGISFGAATWTDNTGNLWIYGGYCQPSSMKAFYYSDLWKYDVSTNEWTWVNGPGIPNQAAVYGVKGNPDPANNPGGRSEIASAWISPDTAGPGNLWLIGGFHNVGGFNDLWKYNIASDTWTWMKGSNTAFQSGTYGTQGLEAPANTPGGRATYSKWKDNAGNFWLYGGWIYSSSYTSFSDLWRYNPTTNNWAWMNGSSGYNATGLYGTRCQASAANHPGARLENRAVWTDVNGNFWMFGGGVTSLGGVYKDIMNDLWMYCVATNQWIWVSGDTIANTVGNWGALGVSSPTNMPSGRAGAISWSDNKGHLYLFGGHDYQASATGTYNDLWKYTIDPCCASCSPPVASFTATDTAFCNEGGSCVDFFDKSSICAGATGWKWSFPGAIPDTSTAQNPTGICYYNPGTYAVTLIVYNASGSDTATVAPTITFGSAPPAPTIIMVGKDTLICSHATTYQWYFNGSPIAGATDSFYVATQTGSFAVLITNDLGCSRISNSFPVVIDFVFGIQSSVPFQVYPNPVSAKITVKGSEFGMEHVSNLGIFNVFGEKIYSKRYDVALSKSFEETIDVSKFGTGVYFMELQNDSNRFRIKFIKE